jgi:phenylpropionate dioxygenase-like ring-hydroxylating dioxygenase large terminal subunit
MAVSPQTETALRAEKVRPDFVPASDYISSEFAQLEKERLWPKVWQLACREEEIPRVGDFVTYDICDQSLIIVRSAPDRISGYYNVCLHRGRRLTEKNGNVVRFHCNYHGWQWGLDGRVLRVLDREDWQGCGSMEDGDLHLREVKVDTWAGFVFVNMDPQAEPLAEYLAPVPEMLGPYEYDKMRFRFYASFRVPCNWKVAQEAFDEGYHVAATHPQLLPFQGEDWTQSFAHGRHGMFCYPGRPNGKPPVPFGAPSPRLNKPVPADLRPGVVGHFDELTRTLPVLYSLRDGEATRRLLTEVAPETPPLDVLMKALEFQREAAIACGAGWPNLTPEQMGRAGVDWHIFPNMVTLPYPDGVIVYRSRPDGDNPDSCLYDVWGLQRYAPGAEPAINRQYFYGRDDWRQVGAVSIILEQDFLNMEQVQRGMKSHGFPGNRTSPMQEVAISNMHRALREEFLFAG